MKEVDVISGILKLAMEAFPSSAFIQSLSHQYLVRGWLSKKQMQGLLDKARQINDIAPGKLATLEAQILKMPNRYRSDIPETRPLYEQDEQAISKADAILDKYPAHKRVLFLRAKIESNSILPAELSEIDKLFSLLIKKG